MGEYIALGIIYALGANKVQAFSALLYTMIRLASSKGTNLALFNKEFEQVIKFLTKSKSNLILLGDYNISLLNHEIHTETDDFFNLLSANTLLP